MAVQPAAWWLFSPTCSREGRGGRRIVAIDTMRRLMAVAAGILACGLGAGCAPPPGQQLCEAIAKRDVGAVRRVLAAYPLDLSRDVGGCVPAEVVFGAAKTDDIDLTTIGVELVKAGLPAFVSWEPAGGTRIWAVEAAAANGNVELVRALAAVGLDLKGRETERALRVAASAGHLSVVKVLVEQGVDLEGDDPSDTPMARALANGHDEIVRFLEETLAVRAAAAAAAEAAAKGR